MDRPDVWDLRSPPFNNSTWNWKNLVTLVRQKDINKINDIFEKPSREYAYPTKLPVGRLEIGLPPECDIDLFSLNLQTAHGIINTKKGNIEVFTSATEPVCLAIFNNIKPSVDIRPAPFGTETIPSIESHSSGELTKLGYPAPEYGTDGNISWTLQNCSNGFKYVILVEKRTYSHTVEIAFTVTTSNDGDDPLEIGKQLTKKALDIGFDGLFEKHKDWWHKFWSKSSIKIPDDNINNNYYLTQYFYGSASRYYPIALQGLWTADEGTLPPWKGDYHNDLNTEMTYWPYLTANHLEEGKCFLDFMWSRLPKAKEIASQFYHTRGACVPGVMALNGDMMAGWAQYAYSPVHGAWVAHLFYLHWRYTHDKIFLDEMAYPYCKAIAECIEDLLETNQNAKFVLPISSSPEINNNSSDAWLTPNSNYDLSLMRWLFIALEEMAKIRELLTEARHWKLISSKLDELAFCHSDNNDSGIIGALKLSPKEPLNESHRHFSHLMSIYPLGILNIESSDKDREIIESSINHIDSLGMHNWVGYSFTWMACIAARCGMPNRTLNMLELFYKGFTSRNGFHLNGDYKKIGLVAAKYRPFTLEANFAAAQAIHEMLLQSWNSTIRIFPSIPSAWEEINFENLRAEGGFLISAYYKNETVKVEIKSEHDNLLSLRDPFNNQKARWNTKNYEQKNGFYFFQMKAGQKIKGTLIT